MEDNWGVWSEDPLHGKENPFHNIQPREEHSLSKSTIKRRLHANKYRGFTTGCKQSQIRLCQKTFKKPEYFNLYQNDGKTKYGTAHDSNHTTSSVKHGGAVWWHEHAWLPVALGYWCLQKTEAAGFILKCIGLHSLPRFSQMQHFFLFGFDWTVLHSTNGQWPKTFSKSNDGKNGNGMVFLMVKKWNILQWPSQSPDLNPIEHAFHLRKTKLEAERPTNKQQLKLAALKAWQSITKEETVSDVHVFQT